MVVVADGDPHAGLLAAIFIDRRARYETDVFERAVAFVLIQEVGRRVVRDEYVYEAVAIEIAADYTHPVVPVGVRHARLDRDVRERPVPVVVVERVARALQTPGAALDFHPAVQAWPLVGGQV